MTPDTADQQADAGDGKHEDNKAGGDLRPEGENVIGAEDGEVIVFLHADAAALPQEHPDLLGDHGFVFSVVVLDGDDGVEDLGVDFMEGGEGKDGDVVVGIAATPEQLLVFIEDADDGKNVAIDDDIFADGVFGVEELLRGIVAEDSDVGARETPRFG